MEVLARAGWGLRVFETVSPGDGTRLAQLAVEDGAQVVIAAGGDGTVNEVANGIVGTDVALGVLPVGTGNVWAKEMGYPGWTSPLRHPLKQAAQGLVEATVHTIDVGRANGQYFLLWVGVGFDAAVAHEVEPLIDVRRRLGNLLYAVSGLSMALNFVGTRSTVVVDDQVYRGRVLMVIITNVHLYGGGLFNLAPAARLDDGMLEVFLFRGHGTAATVRHFFSLLTQGHMHDPQLWHYRGSHIEIRPDRPLAVHVDGDACGQTPLVIDVLPRALRALVPPTAPDTLFISRPLAVGVR